jgi:hypothetical protein
VFQEGAKGRDDRGGSLSRPVHDLGIAAAPRAIEIELHVGCLNRVGRRVRQQPRHDIRQRHFAALQLRQ